MSEFRVTVPGGSSVRLPTAGKYCDRDIAIEATAGAPEMLKIHADESRVSGGELIIAETKTETYKAILIVDFKIGVTVFHDAASGLMTWTGDPNGCGHEVRRYEDPVVAFDGGCFDGRNASGDIVSLYTGPGSEEDHTLFLSRDDGEDMDADSIMVCIYK